MINVKKLNSSSLFKRITISYLIFLVIVFSIFFTIYNWLYNNLEKETVVRGENLNKQVKKVIDTQLLEVKNSAVQMSQNKSILKISPIIFQNSSDRYHWARELSNTLVDYSFTNEMILDTVIYFETDETFIQPGLASVRPELFYDSHVRYLGLSYKEWKSMLFDNDKKKNYFMTKKIDTDNTVEETLVYVYYIPDNRLKNPNGCILIHIDINEIFKQLEVEVFGESTTLMIIDENSELLVSHNLDNQPMNFPKVGSMESFNFENLAKEKVTVLKTQSNINDWQYITLIPYNHLMKKVNNIKIIFLILFCVFVLAGIIMTIYIGYKNTKPIRDIVHILNTNPNNKKDVANEISFIKGSINHLINNNSSLKNELGIQKQKQKSVFISQLLFGEFNNDKEIQEYIEYIEFESIKSNKYVVIIGSIEGFENDNGNIEDLEQISKYRVVLRHLIKDNKQHKIYANGIRKDRIGIIVCMNENVKKLDIENVFNNISKSFLSEFNIRCTFAASKIFEKLSDTPTAYIQAVSVFDYHISSRELLWYEEDIRPVTGYFYPIEFESRVISLIRVGEYEGVKNIFNEIKTKNNKIDFYNFKFLALGIKSTLIKVVFQSVKMQEKRNEFIECIMKIDKPSKTIEEFIEKALGIIKTICFEIESTLNDKNDKNQALKNNIVEFINENFSDKDMSLYIVATKFNFSEKYFSKIFKELIGENVTTYIEKLRMSKAIELMNSNLSILEIAEKAGYTNKNTFYKAFKRNYLISPGEYRQKLKE